MEKQGLRPRVLVFVKTAAKVFCDHPMIERENLLRKPDNGSEKRESPNPSRGNSDPEKIG
jgi:hypothetical protein